MRCVICNQKTIAQIRVSVSMVLPICSNLCFMNYLNSYPTPGFTPAGQPVCTQCGNIRSSAAASMLCFSCAHNVPTNTAHGYSTTKKGVQMDFTLANGDTDDYTKVTFDVFSDQGKILKSIWDMTIPKEDRNWHMTRKAWFVRSEHIGPFVKGIETMIKNGILSNFKVVDNRIKLESFEEFFESHTSNLGAQAKAKPELVKEFHAYLNCQTPILLQDLADSLDDLKTLKVVYRKAALALHPDRNNGDGSKMAELNVIWTQLQPLLK